MASLFIQEVEDFEPIRQLLEDKNDVVVHRHPAHIEYVFDRELVIEREPTGLRHALWYSCVAGIRGAQIVQFDKTRLRLVANGA